MVAIILPTYYYYVCVFFTFILDIKFVGRTRADSFLFICFLFFTCISIFLYIGYFVCDSASKFGAMGSTSFFGVFLASCFYERTCYFLGTCIIFLSQVLGLSLGLFLFYRYFSVPYFGLACDHGNSFLCLGG